MNKVVGDIAVTVGADVSGLLRGMQKGRRATNRFGTDFARVGARVGSVAAVATTAIAGIAAAGIRLQRSAATAAVEVANLSRIANANTTEFQRMAAAAETVNISQEKLSDILKDVNDRVGDFVATGGGPMADFFENIAPKVGVTADQFARLSGPEALQLYVSSLEAANLNQQEMTFYLEAMASDSTALLPLLRDNGRALKQMGDEAQRTGRVMSEDVITNGQRLDTLLKRVSGTLRNQMNTALLENGDKIAQIAIDIEEIWVPALGKVVGVISTVVERVGALTRRILAAGRAVTDFFTRVELSENRGRGRDPQVVGMAGLSRNPFDTQRGAVPLSLDIGGDTGTGFGAPRDESDTGGGGDPFADLEGLRQRYQAYATTIQEQYDDDLAKLREYREARKITLEEFNQLEENLERDRTETLRGLELRANQERLRTYSSALGDLAGVARSGSEKLFKIGKAAATAEAVVSGYSAATAAWDKGMKIGGPPLAAAFTAASLARTGALIGSLRATNIGSGGGAVASGSGVASADAGSQAGTYFNVQLDGTNFGQDSVRGLISMINEEVEKGAVLKGVRVV